MVGVYGDSDDNDEINPDDDDDDDDDDNGGGGGGGGDDHDHDVVFLPFPALVYHRTCVPNWGALPSSSSGLWRNEAVCSNSDLRLR